MSKLRESAQFIWTDATTRKVVLILLSAAVVTTAAICNFMAAPASQRATKADAEASSADGSRQEVPPAAKPVAKTPPSGLSQWWNSQSHTITCQNCRSSICSVRVYAGKSPLVTKQSCSNCGIIAEYTTHYKHFVSATCSEHTHNFTACRKVEFPCRPGVLQTAELKCWYSQQIQFQCNCKR